MSKILILLAMVTFSNARAAEPLKVITSTTDLAWAVKEIGGDHVDVKSLLKGTENPHYIDAVPEYIRLAADAQVAVVVGLELEVGWMPKVLSRSGNAQVQPGGKGYVESGTGISVLEKPAGSVDRSMGDVHPGGNPHYWLSPDAMAKSMVPVTETLSNVDPAHAKDYQAGLARLNTKLDQIKQRGLKKLQPLLSTTKGPVMVEYHKEFTYFLQTYGLKSLGSLEEKPGITPSAGRLAEISLAAKNAGVKFGLAGDTAPKKTIQRFSELSGIPVMVVPLSIQPKGKAKDYDAFQDILIEAVVKGLQNPKS